MVDAARRAAPMSGTIQKTRSSALQPYQNKAAGRKMEHGICHFVSTFFHTQFEVEARGVLPSEVSGILDDQSHLLSSSGVDRGRR